MSDNPKTAALTISTSGWKMQGNMKLMITIPSAQGSLCRPGRVLFLEYRIVEEIVACTPMRPTRTL
jgi:hypothetical protein